MTIQRWSARADGTRHEIVQALKAAGCIVFDLRRPVDLLIGFQGRTLLLELKRPPGPRGGTSGRKHTKAQESFLSTWNGGPVATVHDVEGALRAIGVK